MELYLLLNSLPAWLAIIVWLALVVTAIMWVFLPFAIVGIQRKTIKILEVNERLLHALNETNKLLYKQNHNLRDIRAELGEIKNE